MENKQRDPKDYKPIELTDAEFFALPPYLRFIFGSIRSGFPLSGDSARKAVNEYPDYFVKREKV